MDASPEEAKKEIFKCKSCGLEEEYDVYGRVVPHNKYVTFKEDCFVRSDPFSPPKQKQFLVLGSKCAVCQEPLCLATACSVFYDSRFCLPCAQLRISTFPEQLQMKINTSKDYSW